MALRDYLPNNFWWKLLSVVLAILIWFAIRFGIHPESTPGSLTGDEVTRAFPRVPITVLTAASDIRNFRVNPAEVDVVVSGSPDQIEKLKPIEIEAYVNLVDIKDARGLVKRIRTTVPAGVNTIRVTPRDVTVDRIESSK